MSLKPDPLALKDFHRAMIGAAICVLLIACANVAALMLARGIARQRDYALRLALGAGRWEIAREVIVEVCALALAGSVMGALMATWVVGLMTHATPEGMTWLGFVAPQWSIRVLGVSALAVFASVAVAGAFPAWHASRTDPMRPLKESGGGTTGRAGTRFRWLVMAELALSMMLVMGASLMMKSTVLLDKYDFGYEARSLVSGTLYFGWRDSTPPAVRDQIRAEALVRVRATPGVKSASVLAPCYRSSSAIASDLVGADGKNLGANTICSAVSDGFFATIGVPIVAGRDFAAGDGAGGGVAILGERLSKRLFPHEPPIGRMVHVGGFSTRTPWLPVVGVVRDHSLYVNPFPELGRDTSSMLYISLATAETEGRVASERGGDIVIRPDARATGVSISVTRLLKSLAPPRAIVRVQPWQNKYFETLAAERFLSLIFTLLGAASLALGAAGLFSVISYVAGQRLREFAVRLALGATRNNVLRLVLHEGLIMALGGTAVGAGLGMWAGFLLWDKMWGVYPVDVGALIAGEATLLAVTMLACLGPALRATRADPVEVLRAA
jgi:predicted permease